MKTLQPRTRVTRTRLFVAFLIAAAIAVGSLLAGAPHKLASARTLYRISPELTLKARPRLERVLATVGDYLERVDESLPDTLRGTLHHEAWGAYGSGFLAHNRVSNDLDVFINVDLGAVRSSDPTRKDAARELLERIDVYRTHAGKVAKGEQRPELALYRFMDALPPGPLVKQAAVLDELAASLRLALAKKSYLVAVRHRGVTQVSELDQGIAYLPLVTNATFFSNALEQEAGVFTGVRGISLQFLFTADIDLEDKDPIEVVNRLPISPLAPPRQAAKLWQQAYSGVYATKYSAQVVASLLPPGKEASDARLSYALGFLGSMAFEREVRHYPIKFLKRFHPWLDAMGPTLSSSERATFVRALEQGLSGDAAVLADQLKTQGEVLEDIAAHPELLKLFSKSGDVEHMLEFFQQSSAALRGRHADLASDLDKLDAQLKVARAEPAKLRTAAGAISDAGFAMMRKLSADETLMRSMWERAERSFSELGYRPVRVYAADRGSIALHADDLKCGDDALGLLTELNNTVTTLQGGPISALSAKDPRLTNPKGLPRPYTLFVRCSASEAEQQKFLQTKRALHAAQSDFRIQQ